MKYILVILIILFTGCKKNTIDLSVINSIQYNNTIILESDYDNIKKIVSTINFNCSNNKKLESNILKIVTGDYIYNLNILNDYIEYEKDDKYCISSDESVKVLYEQLDNLEEIYNNDNFFTLNITDNYEENDKDEIIKIDKGNKYLIINSLYDIFNFSINEIKLNNDSYEEINLLYNKEKITNNIVIRKNDFRNIKISFSTKYNYVINIIPYLENDTIKFKKQFYQKNKTP